MDELKVPGALTGTGVERYDTRSVEIIARAKPPVVIDSRAVGRNVHQVILRISREGRPGRHVSGPFPGIVFPGFVAVFSGLGNDIEFPFEITGAQVIGEDVAGYIFYARLVVALFRRVTHHDCVVHHDGRRRRRDVSGLKRDAFIGVVGMTQIFQHVHDTAFRESVHANRRTPIIERHPGLGIKRRQEKARRHNQHHAPSINVAKGHAFTIVGPHGIFRARGFWLAIGPDGFTGLRIDGDDMAVVAGHGIKQTVDQRRRGTATYRPEAGTIPLPGDFQIPEIFRRQLVSCGVASVRKVIAKREPLVSVLS